MKALPIPVFRVSSLFDIIQPTMMTVLLSAQYLDVSLYLVNLLKRIINLGCDEKADKYERDGRVALDIMFGELRHYLMNM